MSFGSADGFKVLAEVIKTCGQSERPGGHQFVVGTLSFKYYDLIKFLF